MAERSAMRLFINLNIHVLLFPLICCFPVHFLLFMSIQPSLAVSLNANGRYGNKALTPAETQ